MKQELVIAKEINANLIGLHAYKAQVTAEVRLQRKLSKLFGEAGKEILKELSKVGRVPADVSTQSQIVQPLVDATDTINKVIAGDNVQAGANGRRSTLMDLRSAGMTFNFRDMVPMPDQISKLIKDKTFVASERTLSRITGNVMENLTTSYEKGLGIDDAARNLRSQFSSIRNSEALRIARTEIQSSQNLGAYETQRELDVEYHQWWAASDARVRNGSTSPADHVFMNGQIVRLGDPFSNGLMYPGDTSGPIDEWINCRCRTVPFIMPLGYMAPPNQGYFYKGELIAKNNK